ncbi:hypothetical protein RB195_016864 [Necator americanus]|uniref:Uncharacterized protein n=1 Tax=Necator americanus TaxID=51031 RepID=A0ABR1C2I0_NECAM
MYVFGSAHTNRTIYDFEGNVVQKDNGLFVQSLDFRDSKPPQQIVKCDLQKDFLRMLREDVIASVRSDAEVIVASYDRSQLEQTGTALLTIQLLTLIECSRPPPLLMTKTDRDQHKCRSNKEISSGDAAEMGKKSAPVGTSPITLITLTPVDLRTCRASASNSSI